MYLGIDVGGTNLKYGVFDSNINLMSDYSVKTNQYGPKKLIEQIITTIKNSSKDNKIESIGIGFPAVVSPDGFIHLAPNLKDFKNINLLQELKKEINIPILIENDSNIGALAELEIGEGKNDNTFLYITLGTGVGGSLVYKGSLFKGMNFGAGEIGFTLLKHDAKLNYDNEYIKRGVMESYLGKKQLVKIAKKKLVYHPHSNLAVLKFGIKQLTLEAENGDECALDTFNEYGYLLGRGISSSLNFLDINQVIIGGGLSHSYEYFQNALTDTISKYTLPSLSNKIQIKKAAFTSKAGLYGSAILAKYNLENKHYYL